jgi:Fe-S-cluster containining protein
MCDRCGDCCRYAYLYRIAGTDKDTEDYGAFLEFTRPALFSVVPGGLMMKARCEHLADDNTCRVYADRPQICRDFLCEKAGGPRPARKERAMKLAEIVMAQEALQRLSALKMPPQAAYRLLKYLKLVDVERAVCEQQRVKLVLSAAGVTEGIVNLEPGTPAHAQFIAEYGKVLETESDLKPFDMKMAELLALLDAAKGNVLSASDLGALEPFFTA